MTVDELIQTACEDLSMVSDGEVVDGDLKDSCVGLLNRAISELNSDEWLASSDDSYNISCAGNVYFRELETGESKPNTIGIEPPDTILGVSRKVGNSYTPLRSCDAQSLAAMARSSLPVAWNYGTKTETAPSGNTRLVGVLALNGTAPCELRIFAALKIKRYESGERIYLSDLYHDLILYALEMRMCRKYKLKSYENDVSEDLTAAKNAIDKNRANNAALNNGGTFSDPYYDLLNGVGF